MIYRLHKEGKIYLAVTILVLLILGLASWIYPSYFTYGLLALVIFFLIVFLIFFRNPKRSHVVRDTELVLSPCDGKVVVIEKTTEQEYIKGEAIQVSIFMSPLNVHSNRSPVTGEVVYQKYHPGQYLVAWHPKSSELNERNTVVIKRKNHLVLVRQIAGKVARKIVSYTITGAQLARGEEFGFIKFGSRVDVFLPPETTILVKIGDTVKGGVTDIAHFKST